MLLHQFSLTYLMLNSSRPLLQLLHMVVLRLECGNAVPTQSSAADLTPAHGQNLQPIFEQEEDEDLEEEQEAIDHPRLR